MIPSQSGLTGARGCKCVVRKVRVLSLMKASLSEAPLRKKPNHINRAAAFK